MTRQVNHVLRDQWRQRIKRQRATGLSIAEFCRREDISAHGFYVVSVAEDSWDEHGTPGLV